MDKPVKKYDIKHIVYHALVAIYFIWLVVFAMLLVMALNSYFTGFNMSLSKMLLTWIFLNLFMGTVLFVVIQKFGRQTVLSRIILYGYFVMTASSITTVLIIIQ